MKVVYGKSHVPAKRATVEDLPLKPLDERPM
jgi:hypothetical protein